MSGTFLALVNGFPRSQAANVYVPVYDQRYTVASPITSGTAVTLPASGSYVGAELQVYFNGQRLEPSADYNYVGSGTKTQVTFTFNLVVGDLVDFRVDRSP